MIEFENLLIGYNSPMAELEVQKITSGSITAIIGSNGSGKSTMLHTISGQIKPIKGTIIINQQDNRKINIEQYAKLISFVPSVFPQVEFTTVKQFISLGRTPYFGHFAKMNQQDQEIIDNICQELKITQLRDKYVKQLSDGQKQLCAIARAMAQQTPIILLDEPTSFLDYANKRKIFNLLTKLSQNHKRTIIFSSHDIETIFNLKIPMIGIRTKMETNLIENIPTSTSFEQIINTYYNAE